MSERLKRWKNFVDYVSDHIENYTVPQYGDYPNDQMTDFDIDEICMNMKRYENRAKSNSRGRKEALRDAIKIAHYACELWYLQHEGGDAPYA